MPEKDGSDDKKSTKSVISKKQKQFMNKEQLDLTSVAESFGGQIVGEPVELDEFKTGNPVVDTVTTVATPKTGAAVNPYVGAGVAGWQVGKWLDKLITPRLNPLPKYKDLPQFKDIKKYKKDKDGVTKLYTKKELEALRKEKGLEKKKDGYTKLYSDDELLLKRNALQNKKIKDKEIEKIAPPKKKEDTTTKPDIKTTPKITTTPPVEVDKETKFDPQKQVDNKSKNIDNKSKTIIKNKSGSDTKKDSKTNLAIAPAPLLTRIRNRTRTKVGTGKAGIPKLPRLPGTVHNVGRRVNPQ